MSSTGETGHRSAPGDRSGIVTPDAVGLDLQIATLGSRGAAYLLDVLLFGAVATLLVIGQLILGASGFVPGWLGIALLLLFAFLWQFGYPIGCETLARGRTPGKAAMGLRVVTVEGAPVGLRHATVRATVGLVELLGTGGAIAVLSSFASPRSQRLGDMAAGTLVIRERGGGATPTVETFTAPPGLEAYTARLDVSGLRASDYATLRETLRRAGELPPAVRAELTSDLARRFVGKVQPPPPASCPAEAFLTCIAAAVQARRSRDLATVSAQSSPPADDRAARPSAPQGEQTSGRLPEADPDRPPGHAPGQPPHPARPAGPAGRGGGGFTPPA